MSRLSVVTPALALLSFSVLAENPMPIPVQTITGDPQDWPMYNHDSQGTRWNTGERALKAANVGNLKEKWRYFTAGDVYATPAVVDKTIYFGDSSGTFYAMTHNGRV